MPRDREGSFIYASRVFGRNERRFRREWIVEVGIVRMTVSLQLPMSYSAIVNPGEMDTS